MISSFRKKHKKKAKAKPDEPPGQSGDKPDKPGKPDKPTPVFVMPAGVGMFHLKVTQSLSVVIVPGEE